MSEYRLLSAFATCSSLSFVEVASALSPLAAETCGVLSRGFGGGSPEFGAQSGVCRVKSEKNI